MGNRLLLNASVTYGRSLSVRVPESGGADTEVQKMATTQTHVLGPGGVLLGGAVLHTCASWGEQSLRGGCA